MQHCRPMRHDDAAAEDPTGQAVILLEVRLGHQFAWSK